MQIHDAHSAPDQVGKPGFARLVERIQGGDDIALENLMAAFMITLRRMVDLYLDSVQRPPIDADELVRGASSYLSHGLRTGQLEVTAPAQLVQAASRYLIGQTSPRIGRAPELESTFEGDLISTMSDRPLLPAVSRESDGGIRSSMNRLTDFDRWIIQLYLEYGRASGS